MTTMTMMTMWALGGSVILAATALVSLLLRNAAASVRHLVWTVGLGAALLLPAFHALGVRVEVPVPASWVRPAAQPAPATIMEPEPTTVAEPRLSPERSVSLTEHPGRDHEVPGTRAVVADGSRDLGASARAGAAEDGRRGPVAVAAASGHGAWETGPERAPVRPAAVVSARSAGLDRGAVGARPGGPAVPWGPVFLALWSAGALVALTMSVRGQLAAYRLVRGPEEPVDWRLALRFEALAREMGVQDQVRLVVSRDADVPATWGLVRSAVVLPADAPEWPPETLTHALLHELAHVARRDCLARLLGEVARAAHWPNPLAWLALARQRAEGERACDDRVLDARGCASAYAGALLRVVRELRGGSRLPAGALAMARSSDLADRIRAVLDARRPRGRVGRWTASVALGSAVALTTSLAGLTPVARAEAPGPQVETTDRSFEPPTVPPTPASAAVAGAVAATPHGTGGLDSGLGLGRLLEGLAAVAATEPPAWPEPALQVAPELCAFTHSGRRSTSVNSDDHRMQIRWETDDCRVDIDLRGDVRFSDDDTRVESMASGALFEIEERTDAARRRARLEAGRSGVERRYWRDGREVEWGAEADAWLARVLPELFRHTTLNADSRVRRLLERGGPTAVFAEVDRMASDHVRRRYLELLMEHARLSEAQYADVVRRAGRFESDHHVAELLSAVVERAGLRAAFQEPMLQAAEGMESDHQKRKVLEALLRSEGLTEAQFDRVVRAAASVGSDHHKAEILAMVAREGRLSERGREAFLAALGTVDSDHQHRMVVEAFLDTGTLSGAELSRVLGYTRGIGSDHHRSEILERVAREYELTGAQVDAYLEAAREISSDHQLHRAALAVLSKRSFTDEHLLLVLAIADDIDSSHQKGTVLGEVVKQRRLDEPQVLRFLSSAADIGSDHQLSETLLLLIEDEELSEAAVLRTVQAAGLIDSDHGQGKVLLALARRHRLEGPAREAYLALAEEMGRHQRNEVLAALVR